MMEDADFPALLVFGWGIFRQEKGKCLAWAVEKNDAGDWLHVKVNFSPDALRGAKGITAKFSVLAGP